MIVNLDGLWEHQQNGVTSALKSLASSGKRICLTSPTGGGKTRMMSTLIKSLVSDGKRVGLLTNRKMLLDQTVGVMQREGIECGVIASGWDGNWLDRDLPVQIIMAQTEIGRLTKRMDWERWHADVMFIDECHNQTGTTVCKYIDESIAHGTAFIGVTATPLGIGHIYDELIAAGTNSELRGCGAHVPCVVYSPDEPDWQPKSRADGEFAEADVVKAMKLKSVFGSLLNHWKLYNHDNKPGIVFGPDVQSSRWIAHHLSENGIRTAHIDGELIIVDGKEIPSSQENREWLMQESKGGRVHLCNRFVLREGIDAPWLSHGVLATMFGSLTSYIQSVGRLLRSFPGLSHVTLQDHGGNYRRHGDPNSDREWNLLYNSGNISNERINDMKEGVIEEPITCIQCSITRTGGGVCPGCGYKQTARMRRVVQDDGSLRMVTGNFYKPATVKVKPSSTAIWERVYWRCRNTGKNFNQALGLFQHENWHTLPRDMPFMPKNKIDWHRKVADVPMDKLYAKDHVSEVNVQNRGKPN